MSVAFPSPAFFEALKVALGRDPTCVDGLDPCEAYCGIAVGQQLTVLEFDGRECAAVVPGGNELDLDFVVAGPSASWKKLIEAAIEGKADESVTLPALVAQGALAIRSSDDEGPELARAAMPFLQIFLERARGMDVEFA